MKQNSISKGQTKEETDEQVLNIFGKSGLKVNLKILLKGVL